MVMVKGLLAASRLYNLFDMGLLDTVEDVSSRETKKKGISLLQEIVGPAAFIPNNDTKAGRKGDEEAYKGHSKAPLVLGL